MKKFVALLAVLICAFLLFGCGESVDVKFVDMGAVLSGGEYERCVYSVEISDGKPDAVTGKTTKYTDDDNSEMSLTFRKQTDGTALIEMEMKITFVSTPPYAPAENAAKEKIDYTGLTDTVTSKVWFNGYSQDFNPIRIEKTVTLETSKKWDKDKDGNSTDKSFSAEFTYPVRKNKPSEKENLVYTDSTGKETKLDIKEKTVRNAFDNEQIYYMASAFLRGTLDTSGETALGYTKQYKVFNLADRCIYGKGPASLTFAVGADRLGNYENISVGTDGSAEVTVSFSQGQPLIMRYSLDDSISIGGKTFRPRKNLLLGYKQESVFNVNSFSTVTAYTLKDYSTVEA